MMARQQPIGVSLFHDYVNNELIIWIRCPVRVIDLRIPFCHITCYEACCFQEKMGIEFGRATCSCLSHASVAETFLNIHIRSCLCGAYCKSLHSPENYATDPLTLWNGNIYEPPDMPPPYVAFLNCSDRVSDDPRYVEVNGRLCDSGGHVYALLSSSAKFTMMDIKVGCHLKAATFINNNHCNKVSYANIHECLHNGFSLYWVTPVICIDHCGKGATCFINETTHEIECQHFYCQVGVGYGNRDCGYVELFIMGNGLSTDFIFK
ncbi:hypothetical protein ACSQ67_024190 [Phaseolus vulgaris]